MDILTSEFLSSFKKSIRSFSPELRSTYSAQLDEFKANSATAQFESINTQEGFEDPTLRGVAHRMYWWFPTHFFKFQDAMLRWEEHSQLADKLFLLKRPQVTFIDLGCGAGAASVAVLSIIEQHQTFLKNKNLRIEPILVNFIGVDPCQPELDTYIKFLSEYSSQLDSQKIRITIQTVCEAFPNNIHKVIEAVNLHSGHALIIGMSNLINWIWNEADEILGKKSYDGLNKMQPKEIDALKELAKNSDFDLYYVIGIATKTNRLSWLVNKLISLFDKLLNLFNIEHGYLGDVWKTDAEVLFENPENSRWSKERAQASSKFFVETVTNIEPTFSRDKALKNILSKESLVRSWIKAQNWILYEALADRVELKLFELNYEAELELLKNTSLEKMYDVLNTRFDMPFEFPKNRTKNRPKSLPRLEEQIFSIAIALEHKNLLTRASSGASYSFHLAPLESEFMYQHFFELYSEYVSDIIDRAGNEQICITDLKSFYNSISQEKLTSNLTSVFVNSKRSENIFTQIINRDCHANHQPNYGILQGHSISGLLANYMLFQIDDELIEKHNMTGRYSRFTDDITITGINSDKPALQLDEIVSIQSTLKNLDSTLMLNEDKTQKLKHRTDFEKKLNRGKDFDSMNMRFRKLLLPLFVMNNTYRAQFAKSSLNFVYEYHKLLEGIGIYVSPEWLYRKLDEYSSSIRLITSIYKIIRGRYAIKFPDLPTNSSPQSKLDWANKFSGQNPIWIGEKDSLKLSLSNMFNSAAMGLINAIDTDDTSYYARTAKFSLNRLGVFGGGETSQHASWLLINRPWDVNVAIACKNLGRLRLDNELINIIENALLSYVRAFAIKSLGIVRTSLSAKKLAEILDTKDEPIERLMASEALLEVNLWNDISEEQIIGWMQMDASNPYLYKNIILILAQAYPAKLEDYLGQLDLNNTHLVVNRAIHYTRTKKSTENLLWRPEPEIFRNFRAKSYPIIEELIREEGSYKFGSP